DQRHLIVDTCMSVTENNIGFVAKDGGDEAGDVGWLVLKVGVQFDDDVGIPFDGFGKALANARAQASIGAMRNHMIRTRFDRPGLGIVGGAIVYDNDFERPA